MTRTYAQPAQSKLLFTVIALLLLHSAGFLGMHSTMHEFFVKLTPANLMISAFLLFLNHKEFNRSFFIFCVVIFFSGFFIEVIGVKTEMIFGDYVYRDTLGFRILTVPVIIGLNWLMLVYSAGVICERIPANPIVKSICGALLMVLLDYFIEPVAQRYNFWDWDSSHPPVINYIGWFIVSFLMLLFFYRSAFSKQNPAAFVLYLVQFGFFLLFYFYP
ncbi:MAG: carotenoid biosynthesis protein [Bacteroidia bacterium]